MRKKEVYRFCHISQALTVIACIIIAVHSFAPGEAAENAIKGTKKRAGGIAAKPFKKDPIIITSDQMIWDLKKGKITYRGRVVAVQGDTTLKSRVLTGYYDTESKEITKIVANDKVHVIQACRVATGAKAVFTVSDQTITLNGNPVLREGRNQISGSRFIFFIEQDRFEVDGPVKSTLVPYELMGQEKKKGQPCKK